MNSFFYIYGLVSFIITLIVLIYLIGIPLVKKNMDYVSKWNDYCFLKNIEMKSEEFDTWMTEVRMKMTDEEYKKWRKEKIRFWYSWISFK